MWNVPARLERVRNMFGEIDIQECPQEFRRVASDLMGLVDLANKKEYNWRYTKATMLDKELCLMYWGNLGSVKFPMNRDDFQEWWYSATSPDLISRARRWLVEKGYCFVKNDVDIRATESSKKWRGHIAGGV